MSCSARPEEEKRQDTAYLISTINIENNAVYYKLELVDSH